MRLTADTKIRLSQVKDLEIWHKLNRLVADVGKKPKHKPAGSPESTGGQFAREYETGYETVKKGLEKQYKENSDKLSTAEKNVITEYIKSSKDFNNYASGENLTAAQRAELKPKIDLLDSALKKSEVGQNIQVYRTINIDPNKINEVINIPGIDLNEIPKGSRNLFINHYLESRKIESTQERYLSTTINPNYQMTGQQEGQTFISYKIQVPHEANGLYVKELADEKHKHQEELLVLRGYTLDLKKVKYNASRDRYEIEAEIKLGGKTNG